MKPAITITLDGKRIAINAKVPRNDLNWYMGRVHVGTPDADVKADIERRCTQPGYTPAIVRQTVAYALYVHRKNQKLFRDCRF